MLTYSSILPSVKRAFDEINFLDSSFEIGDAVSLCYVKLSRYNITSPSKQYTASRQCLLNYDRDFRRHNRPTISTDFSRVDFIDSSSSLFSPSDDEVRQALSLLSSRSFSFCLGYARRTLPADNWLRLLLESHVS